MMALSVLQIAAKLRDTRLVAQTESAEVACQYTDARLDQRYLARRQWAASSADHFRSISEAARVTPRAFQWVSSRQ